MFATTAKTVPAENASSIAEEHTVLARSSFPAPRSLLVRLPLPMPTVNPSACIIAMSENIIPTAPDADVPSFDT